MSLTEHLLPSNTLAAKSTTLSAFYRFLKDEEMSLDDVHDAAQATRDGRGIAVVMDKFAINLAFGEGTRATKLATNTTNGYFGHVKTWLLTKYPQHRHVAERELQVVGGRLSKYCKKRSGGIIAQKAPACRKSDLQSLVNCAYKYGSTASDYLDALLLVWLWHLFGRSSDLSGIHGTSISVYPGGALYVRFTRPKTADETGITLFRDKGSVLPCPINALAVAMVMQTGMASAIFGQVPQPQESIDDENDLLSISLRDL